ncbi:MAG: hypothetical protein JJU42_07150 [Rhodobacteraceae bacterium]|nr:hypothetical protein [Paracoccaceae bacterium]
MRSRGDNDMGTGPRAGGEQETGRPEVAGTEPQIDLDTPLLDLVVMLQPTARFQQRFLHDPEMQTVTLADVVADPPGAWQRLCLVPGAGPAARDVLCSVVAQALQRSGLSEDLISRVRQNWPPPSRAETRPLLVFRAMRGKGRRERD